MNLAAFPNYKSRTIFDENLAAVHMKRTKLVYSKPIYLGMCILDLSKTLMYDFHYSTATSRISMVMTQNCYLPTQIRWHMRRTEDFYADIKDDIESKFDTSDYSKDHPLFSTKNKKVIGTFKDEACGKHIDELNCILTRCMKMGRKRKSVKESKSWL